MSAVRYRGKRKDNGQWIEGSYHYCQGIGTMRHVDWDNGNRVIADLPMKFNSHWILKHQKPCSEGWDVRDTFTPYQVDGETVGWYTGLVDKHGKKIFGGDNVKKRIHLTEGHDFIDYTYEIRWVGWCFGLFIADKHMHGLDPITARTVEIIGNIYEPSKSV